MMNQDNVVKVAIIGAGISGIGSSLQLSKNSIEHIIIEARDRIGGRITSMRFDGVSIQLGAQFVHIPDQGNRIANIIREQGWENIPFNFKKCQYFYQGFGQLNQSIIAQSKNIFDQLRIQVKQTQANSQKSLNLKEATVDYFQRITKKNSIQAINTAQWFLNYKGVYNGADLCDIGVQNCEIQLDQRDFQPEKGLTQILSNIYCRCTPKNLLLNEQVTKIDYSGEIIKIYTPKKVYLAKKVISSFPLGVLLKNKVQFVPQLPQTRRKALTNLGNGNFNKIFVSFEQSFWDTKQSWINFVIKKGFNKYPIAKSFVCQDKYILIFFISADSSKRTGKMADQQIKIDILTFLKDFFPGTEIKIRCLKATKWHEDPLALCSYSYQRTGIDSQQHINLIRAPLDNKVWFIGEHCHPDLFSFAHGAFETGVWAAQDIQEMLS